MGDGSVNKGLLIFLLFCGVLLKSGSSFPTGLSSGEQILVITTTTESTTDVGVTDVSVTTSPNSSGESWEIDNNLSPDKIPSEPSPVSEQGTVPNGKPKPTKPEIYSFRIQSDIRYRYSRTYVTSRVANRDMEKSQEVTFRVVLPETAFISKFIMEIDGKPYEAYVKEKEEAKRVYSQAQSQGQTAGLVEVSTRNSNTFNVQVNIRAGTKATFNLTYEELLTRRLGKYEQVINISPEHVNSVKDFQILVNIEETQNITFLRVPSLRNDIESGTDAEGNNEVAVIVKSGRNANISWSPSVEDQEKLSAQGVGGQFIVQYDIDRNSTSGEVLVMQGYFVHFFSPETLQPLRKHVVFILDVSGSMWGRKMEQLKDSQRKILNDLNSDDFFNIITFSNDVFLWSPNDTVTKHTIHSWSPPSYSPNSKKRGDRDSTKLQPYPATPDNIEKAKDFISSLVASGGTNIHDSIITAIKLTSAIKRARDGIFTRPDEVEEELPEPMSIVDVMKMKNDSTVEVVPGTPEVSQPANPKLSPPPRPATILPQNVESLIIFLTDGEPTVGVTDPPYIRELIQTANKNLSLPIFSLGFGEGADFPFLRKLSLQNNGFARKIYEASDAALQLKGFYNEIASPLLANVIFNYTSPEYNITDLTVTSFPTVFGGTEVAVAGHLVPLAISATVKTEHSKVGDTEVEEVIGSTTNVPTEQENLTSSTTTTSNAPITGDTTTTIVRDNKAFVVSDKHFLDVGIYGSGRDGVVDFKPPVVFCHPIDFDEILLLPPFPPRPTPPPTQEDKFLERLWAYLTIKQLIEKDLKEDDIKKNAVSEDSHVSDSSTSDSVVEPEAVLTLNTTKNPVPEKPATPKQLAVRLALKYGFVTPFTSLVVVKPNSSDVTDAVPADVPSADAADSYASPQSVSFLASFPPQPQPLSLQAPAGYGNRIVGSPAMSAGGGPLYMSIRRPGPYSSHASAGFSMQQSQQYSPPNSGGIKFAAPIRRNRPRPTTRQPAPVASTAVFVPLHESGLAQSEEVLSYDVENDSDFIVATTQISVNTLTLTDIQWFNSSHPVLRVNQSDYSISENTTSSDFVGSECHSSTFGSVLGRCVHLKDCIQQEFISDLELFKTSYFCPIDSTSGVSFVGVCCASDDQSTIATTPLTVAFD